MQENKLIFYAVVKLEKPRAGQPQEPNHCCLIYMYNKPGSKNADLIGCGSLKLKSDSVDIKSELENYFREMGDGLLTKQQKDKPSGHDKEPLKGLEKRVTLMPVDNSDSNLDSGLKFQVEIDYK